MLLLLLLLLNPPKPSGPPASPQQPSITRARAAKALRTTKTSPLPRGSHESLCSKHLSPEIEADPTFAMPEPTVQMKMECPDDARLPSDIVSVGLDFGTTYVSHSASMIC